MDTTKVKNIIPFTMETQMLLILLLMFSHFEGPFSDKGIPTSKGA